MAEEQQSVGPASVGQEDLSFEASAKADVGPSSVGREDVGPSSPAPEASIEPASSVQLQIGFVGDIRAKRMSGQVNDPTAKGSRSRSTATAGFPD
jgi:hypothetical protein